MRKFMILAGSTLLFTGAAQAQTADPAAPPVEYPPAGTEAPPPPADPMTTPPAETATTPPADETATTPPSDTPSKNKKKKKDAPYPS